MALVPVYELAGQQADPFNEEVLAVLFTDEPERREVAPEDTREHTFWSVQPTAGNSSRGWLTDAAPLTDTVPTILEQRYETALTQAFVSPGLALSAEVTVTQTKVNELKITWVITRERGQSTGAVVVTNGGP